jgi:Fibronectin type III domain
VAVTAASTGSATLMWTAPTTNTDGTPVTALSGYTIHYGTSQSSMTQSITITDASATSHVISGLAAGTWYFAIAADAADGTQSAMSNIGSKTI